jgi:hypothetical protein
MKRGPFNTYCTCRAKVGFTIIEVSIVSGITAAKTGAAFWNCISVGDRNCDADESEKDSGELHGGLKQLVNSVNVNYVARFRRHTSVYLQCWACEKVENSLAWKA